MEAETKASEEADKGAFTSKEAALSDELKRLTEELKTKRAANKEAEEGLRKKKVKYEGEAGTRTHDRTAAQQRLTSASLAARSALRSAARSALRSAVRSALRSAPPPSLALLTVHTRPSPPPRPPPSSRVARSRVDSEV